MKYFLHSMGSPTQLGTINLKAMSSFNRTVYFEPVEENHLLVGDCLLRGLSIKFIPFTEPVLLKVTDRVYFLVVNRPRIKGKLSKEGELVKEYVPYKHNCNQ